MPTIDEYLKTLTPPQQAELKRIRSVVKRVVPEAEEGRSYGMPAFMYKGKPFLSWIVRKNHLSIYPFSGKVIDTLRTQLSSYSLSSGTIRYSEHNPFPESLLQEIIIERIKEIEKK